MPKIKSKRVKKEKGLRRTGVPDAFEALGRPVPRVHTVFHRHGVRARQLLRRARPTGVPDAAFVARDVELLTRFAPAEIRKLEEGLKKL